MANQKKKQAIPDSTYYTAKKGWLIERKQVPNPCVATVDQWLNTWNTQSGYVEQESALRVLFTQLCPKNDNLDHVLIKVCTLNDFYSTNIYKVFDVAQVIQSMAKDLDNAFASNQRKACLADTLDDKVKNKTDRAIYSFASKYFSHHNPDIYPIYDSYVDKLLRFYRDTDKLLDFKDNDLKKYSSFCDVIDDFKKAYGLEKYTAKEIDKFLWQVGKKTFPKYV